MDAPLSTLQWDRGALEAACDRAATVRAGVEAYLGRSVFGAGGSVIVRVRLSRVEENGRARVVAAGRCGWSSDRAWPRPEHRDRCSGSDGGRDCERGDANCVGRRGQGRNQLREAGRRRPQFGKPRPGFGRHGGTCE